MEITVLIFILNLGQGGKGKLFLKSSLQLFFFNRGGHILLLPTHLPHLLFFTIFHPSRFSFLGQFLLSIHRTSSWFLCLHRYYISKELLLSYNRVNLSVLNTWDFGSTSQGCRQAKGYCEFLALLLWTPGATLQIYLIYTPSRRPRKSSGLPEEKSTLHVSAREA